MKKLLFRKVNIILLLILVLTFGAFAQKINTEKSVVNFEIDGIGWSTVKGSIKGMSGTLVFDQNNLALSFFNVCINPNTIFTENEKRDNHLKTIDFFYTEKYKTICFQGSEVTKTQNGFIVKGQLSFLGVIKNTEINFQYLYHHSEHILVGKFEINRFDFGLASESYSSTWLVGEIAKIEIRCVLSE